MKTIINIKNDTVLIGDDNGNLEEVHITDLNFTPSIGDPVKVYRNKTSISVTKDDTFFTSRTSRREKNSTQINIINNTIAPTPKKSAKKSSGVNKIIYCLLALIFGGLGFHKFYAGRIGMGILYLLLSWTGIPTIIGFFEAIIGLCKKSDEHGNIIF